MNKIKLYLMDVLNSKIVKHFASILMPTFKEMKSKGVVKIILLALSLSLILIPFNFGMSILKKLFGSFLSLGFESGASLITVITSMTYTLRYARGGELVTIIAFAIISSIVSLLYFIGTRFYLPNGALNSFRIYLEEGRVVTAKEFIQLSKLNIKNYIHDLIIKVAMPIALIGVAGSVLSMIPYISGNSMATMITSILKYALLFKMYADLLGLNGEEEMYKHSDKWSVYAVFMYILCRVTSLGLIISAFNTVFILFALRNMLKVNNSTVDNLKLKEDDICNRENSISSTLNEFIAPMQKEDNEYNFNIDSDNFKNDTKNEFKSEYSFDTKINNYNIEDDFILGE